MTEMVLIPVPRWPAVPLDLPDNAWGLQVILVDVEPHPDNPNRLGDRAEMTVRLLQHEPDPTGIDGTVVIRLFSKGVLAGQAGRRHAVDVDLLHAMGGRWVPAGVWHNLDETWPRVVAITAAAVMELHAAVA